MTTPYDPYASATSQLPAGTQNQIPGNVVGLSSVTINTSEMNFASGANGGMFGYTGQPGTGNLYFTISPIGGVDNYGNTYPTGIGVLAGQMQGVALMSASMDSASTLYGSSLQGPQVLNPTMSGGTAASLVHTMTNTNGQVLGYTVSNTAVTFATNGVYQWTCPTGITTIRVQAWGAGAGGGGGGGATTQGGESGGGGEYAEEPSYPVTPGLVYTIYVGTGGLGAATGFPGGNGSSTFFVPPQGTQSLQVVANGGLAGVSFQGGLGGSGSTNTIHFNGGNGAAADGNTGGAGGGASGGTGSQGNPGNQAVSSSGAAGGAAVTGGGAGGAGGNVGVAGNNGTSPGGGGGGAGYEATAGSSNTYQPDRGTYSYFGNDSGNSNQLRNHDGSLYQGQDGSSNYAGHQYSYMTLPFAQIQSDLASVTVTSVALKIHNLHSYYSRGMYVNMRWSTAQTFGSFGDGGVGTDIQNYFIAQGATTTHNVGLGGGIGVALKNGSAASILFGPTNAAQGNNYYGYFDSGANGGVVPELIVYFGGSISAGNGIDGKVILSYGSGPTPVYTLSVSALQATDTFGNTIQPGFAGPLLTLSNNATPPATNTAATSINANTAGTPVVVNAQGQTGSVPMTQVDTTPFTVTQTTYTALAKSWNILANDAQVNTLYRLVAHGNGTWGNPAEGLSMAMVAFGSTIASFSTGALVLNTAESFGWSATGLIMCSNVGTGGTIRSSLTVTISAFGQNLFPGGSTQGTGSYVGQNNNTGVNTTIANTIQLQCHWSANGATVPTISSFGSMLERLGV